MYSRQYERVNTGWVTEFVNVGDTSSRVLVDICFSEVVNLSRAAHVRPDNSGFPS